MTGIQIALLGGSRPRFDSDPRRLRRLSLAGGAWVDHCPGWLEGHQEVFDTLVRDTTWHSGRRLMYERVVDVPRLTAVLPDDGPGHPIIGEVAAALSAHYRTALCQVGLAYYRDGRDSVAAHGDRLGRGVDECVVAVLSVGAPRRFSLKPVAGGRAIAFTLGWGDLLVMGGTCQRTWQHAVPKVAHAGPRISIQLRPAGVD